MQTNYSITKFLSESIKKYSFMQLDDCIKLCYQHYFSGEHLISDTNIIIRRLKNEFDSILNFKTVFPKIESIGNGLCRIHFQHLDNNPETITALTRIFITSAQFFSRKNVSDFKDVLNQIPNYCQYTTSMFERKEIEKQIQNYISNNCPPVSHSYIFERKYNPHYRVVRQDFAEFFEFFCEIDRLLMAQNNVTVVIDGMCGSGKTTLANKLSLLYDCNVIHADSFFLQPHQRTVNRLCEPGGNIDY